MQDRVPAPLFSFLQTTGELAERRRVRVYAAGGFVRDLLLGVPNLDVDLVVEGDGIRFARVIAQPYKARVVTHKRFGTATVTFPDGYRFDVATARTESYDSPAALPTVQRGSLTQDVRRRDFTINTLFIRLNAPHFGELVDLHNGLRDVHDKTIRVLHGLSFVDDPTRVFRAIRFEQRLGFQLHPDTAVLMKEAVTMGLLRRLSPSRLSSELLHVLSEREPVKTLARLADFKLLQFIHPRLKWSSGLARLLDAVEQAVDLKAMGLEPGPLSNKILDRLLDARLDGTVETEADERRMVSRLVKRA